MLRLRHSLQRQARMVTRPSLGLNNHHFAMMMPTTMQRGFFVTMPRLSAAAAISDSSSIMSGYSQDEVIFTIQTKCTSVEKLLEFA